MNVEPMPESVARSPQEKMVDRLLADRDSACWTAARHSVPRLPSDTDETYGNRLRNIAVTVAEALVLAEKSRLDWEHVQHIEFKRLAAHNRREADDLRRAIGVDCDETVGEGIEKAKRLREENTRLRAALAHSKDPCIYCQLPAAEMGKCQSGFPGCARADDMAGCPEFGAAMQLHDVNEMLAKGLAAGAEQLFAAVATYFASKLPEPSSPAARIVGAAPVSKP